MIFRGFMINITPIFKHLAEKHGDFVQYDKRKSQLCNRSTPECSFTQTNPKITLKKKNSFA